MSSRICYDKLVDFWLSGAKPEPCLRAWKQVVFHSEQIIGSTRYSPGVYEIRKISEEIPQASF